MKDNDILINNSNKVSQLKSNGFKCVGRNDKLFINWDKTNKIVLKLAVGSLLISKRQWTVFRRHTLNQHILNI